MDAATKEGYGMLMLQQGLPKSGFYATTIARLRRDMRAREVAAAVAPVAPHLPFGVLGKAPADRAEAPGSRVAARLDHERAGGCR